MCVCVLSICLSVYVLPHPRGGVCLHLFASACEFRSTTTLKEVVDEDKLVASVWCVCVRVSFVGGCYRMSVLITLACIWSTIDTPSCCCCCLDDNPKRKRNNRRGHDWANRQTDTLQPTTGCWWVGSLDGGNSSHCCCRAPVIYYIWPT